MALTSRTISCRDLPAMVRVLCLSPDRPEGPDAEDMRWHISACPQCHAVTSPLHHDEPRYCPSLQRLPIALYRLGRMPTPDAAEARAATAAMDIAKANETVTHARHGCPMCSLWLPRLQRPVMECTRPLWSDVLAEEFVRALVPALDMAAPLVVERWREAGGSSALAMIPAMSLGFDTGSLSVEALRSAGQAIAEADELAWQPPGDAPPKSALDAAVARLVAESVDAGRHAAPDVIRQQVLDGWRRATSRLRG